MSEAAPTLVASRYRVVRELGRGGMGVVYVVEHTRTGDLLALKLLHGRAAKDPQAIERFKREARASARIKSDHVVKVVDADVAPELDGAPFLVMELLNGDDLEALVRQRGRFSAAEVCDLLSQAARALDKSHGLGIVHRDLKPENLFLHRREDGSTIVKIVDFGISKIVGSDAGSDMTGAGMTNTGAIMGTPLYMAPEQARGLVSQIGPATDVWAVGLIALRLLTGEIYWTANTVAELMVQILAEPLYAPSERWPLLPKELDAWFAQSCAREPSFRFRSVGEQIDALGAALGVHAPTFTPTDRAETSSAPPAARTTFHSGAPTLPLPGASTTTRPHAVGDTGAPLAPRSSTRSRLAPLAAIMVVLAASLGGGAWAVHRAPASALSPPSTATPAERPSTEPTATSSPPTAAATATVDASASATPSAHPSVRPSRPWGPAPRASTPPVAPPPFAPVSP